MTKGKRKDKFKTLTDVLFDAVSTKRPSNSLSEAAFVARLVKRLPVSMIDEAGNIHIDLRDLANPPSRSLFTCHTDTVHSSEGLNKYEVDGDFIKAVGAPLGADDGAGIALLCHMIENNVPGFYSMFRSEESGGTGSRFFAENYEPLLEQFDRAIAFDRKGVSSVITHQRSRCCSDEFGEALANALTTDKLLYATDNTGIFTDTANFTEIIPECTNISCGYENEHGEKERLNVKHLQMLAAQIVQIDWEALPTKRDPKEVDWGIKGFNEPYGPYGLYDWKQDSLEAALEKKEVTADLLYALDRAQMGLFTELNEIVANRYCSSVWIEKFPDCEYYIGELEGGADPHEILDEIYWSVGSIVKD